MFPFFELAGRRDLVRFFGARSRRTGGATWGYMAQYDFELALARELLSSGITDFDLDLHPAPEKLQLAAAAGTKLGIPFPPGLAPVPQRINPAPNPSASQSPYIAGASSPDCSWSL